MKRKHPLLVVIGLCLVLLCAFLTYGIWTTSVYSSLRVALPEGALIIQDTDTHRGIFRSKGIAMVVAQIPEDCMLEFEKTLRDKGFSVGPPVGSAYNLLATVEATGDFLDSRRTMVNYEDEALALVEEPFSDCSAAIYDMDTGLFCYVEYDE